MSPLVDEAAAFLRSLINGNRVDEATAFLHSLINVHRVVGTIGGGTVFDFPPFSQTDLGRLRQALRPGGPAPPPKAEAWWRRFVEMTCERTPNADSLALHWFCQIGDRYAGIMQARESSARELSTMDADDPSPLLAIWVARRPAPNAADEIASSLETLMTTLAAGGDPRPSVRASGNTYRALLNATAVLTLLDGAEGRPAGPRMERLLMQALAIRSDEGIPSHLRTKATGFIVQSLAPAFWAAGKLDRAVCKQLVLENPYGLVQQIEGGGDERTRASFRVIVDDLLDELATSGRDNAPEAGVIRYCTRFSGVAAMVAVCRGLDRHDPTGRLEWLRHVSARLLPPGPDDEGAGDRFREFRPETLFAAAFLVPSWAPLIEREAASPELAGVGGLARWMERNGGAAPWALDYGGARRKPWQAGGVAADRQAALVAVGALSEQRLRAVLKHPIVRAFGTAPIFCLDALRGRNAAEVERRFLKRDKWAVVALGMLPDEGDVRDRYLALRRIATEARAFGSQRRASEELAVEIGLANLAAVAGYDDVETFVWEIEAELATDLDPALRSWTIDEYLLSLGGDEQPAIRVERGGKTLKSVPTAVRRAPEYAEVVAARDTAREQTERVRRRLERALGVGETFDAAAWRRLLALPAGRTMTQRLVLRWWREGDEEPVETLAGFPLAGSRLDPTDATRLQIVHPLDLAQAGTLAAWQARLVATGTTQPVNQLFREVYAMTAQERREGVCRRFAGRAVRLGPFRRALESDGWEVPTGNENGFLRRFPGKLVAELWFADHVAFGAADDTATIGELAFHDVRDYRSTAEGIVPVHWSEALREADLASTRAALDRADAAVSPATVKARGQLVAALAPAAVIEDGWARLPSGAVELSGGAVVTPDGSAMPVPDLLAPAYFPYPEPDTGTVQVVARAFYLANCRLAQA